MGTSEALIREFFGKLPFPIDTLTVARRGTDCFCSISTQEPRLLIGRDGDALLAINHLVQKIALKRSARKNADEEADRIVVDINGYQEGRIEDVQSTAHMLAEQARFYGSSVESKPMNAFERRIIHEFLANRPDCRTESVGEGSERRVVVHCQ